MAKARRKGVSMEFLEKYFPHLASEIKSGRTKKIRIDAVRQDIREAERIAQPKPRRMPEKYRFWGYEPTVIDFIRRCDTEEEALEVINYLEKKGEISREYAERLRKQLKEKGLRSFGTKKEPGYYFKYGGYG